MPRRSGGREVGLMTDVLDVAQYILKQHGPMTTWKLQKLVYYSQAWSLVWDEAPLFPDPIEAWANGPVVRSLYACHAGQFSIGAISGGDATQLDATQRDTVDAVLNFYGDKTSQWLRDLTHSERPWIETREQAGLREGERGDAVIPLDLMAEYYGSLGG